MLKKKKNESFSLFGVGVEGGGVGIELCLWNSLFECLVCYVLWMVIQILERAVKNKIWWFSGE